MTRGQYGLQQPGRHEPALPGHGESAHQLGSHPRVQLPLPAPADSRSELQACNNNNNNNNKPVKESFWSLILQVIVTGPDTRADLNRENIEQCEECKLKAYAFSMEYR